MSTSKSSSKQVHKRKDASKLKEAEKTETISSNEDADKPIIPKNGPPIARIPYQRLWTRGVMMVGVFAVVYFSNAGKSRELPFARHKDMLERRAQDVECSDDYKTEMEKFPGCVPSRCGRLVSDVLVTVREARALSLLASRGLALGTQGAASILDLHSGALSLGGAFVNIHKLEAAKGIFQPEDYRTYVAVKEKIRGAVAHHFGLDANAIYLTSPSFFSRLTALPPASLHDQYWHPHVDKKTYDSFHYTSLLYLSDYASDFTGGRFIFVDKDGTNRTIEPRLGRVSMFTSGSENEHFVERVLSGVRLALTVSFTCDKTKAVTDPTTRDGQLLMTARTK